MTRPCEVLSKITMSWKSLRTLASSRFTRKRWPQSGYSVSLIQLSVATRGLRDQPASLLGQQDRLRREHLLQHRHRVVRIAHAAHEDVDRGEVALRPCVDRDVAFRQHPHAADT